MLMKRFFVVSLIALAGACSGKKTEATPAPAETTAPESGVTESAAGSAAEQGARWSVNYAESRLGFSATQTGKSFDGEFEKFDASIAFDPANLAASSIDVTIDMTSAKTGDRQRDAALPGSDWFKAKDFPTARFTSTNVEQTGEGAYVAHGRLTIRDATRDLDLPFTLAIDGDEATSTGAIVLTRTDYGVGQGEFASDEWVGFEVKVTVDITATR
jgi:polyisoprenoid-binding protein YceI